MLAGPIFKDSADGAIKMGMPFQGKPIRAGEIIHGSPADFDYFCQSWSAASESETMWRAYSPDNNSVRISADVAPLIAQSSAALPDCSIYFGKVSYFSTEEIARLATTGDENRRLQWSRVREGDPWGISWARSLLKKRDAFRHEEEFRLIAIRGQALISSKVEQDLLQYTFDPNIAISQVFLDPRCPDVKGAIDQIKLTGFTGQIAKSALLDPPDLHIWTSPHPRKW